jgi:hypothetical protein
MYIALQNENGASCLIIILNERQVTMSYGGRNRKWHSFQADILKNCDETVYYNIKYANHHLIL